MTPGGADWVVLCVACHVHFAVAGEFHTHPLVLYVEREFRRQHSDCVIPPGGFVEEVAD